MKTLLSLFMFLVALPLAGQTFSVNVGSVSVTNEGGALLEQWRITQFADPAAITLTSSINASVTSFVLTGSLAGLSVSDQLLIDGEVLTLTGISAPNVTVTRAAIGTAGSIGGIAVSPAASHSAGATVHRLQYPSLALLFKTYIAGQAAGQVKQFCEKFLSNCPTINTQAAAQTTATSAIQTFLTAIVQ